MKISQTFCIFIDGMRLFDDSAGKYTILLQVTEIDAKFGGIFGHLAIDCDPISWLQ
jgi:hypothetical protein